MQPLLIAAIALGILLILVLIIILARTFGFPVESEPVEALDLSDINGEDVAHRIGLAVRHRTIANTDPTKTDPEPFNNFHELLRTLYSQVFERLTVEEIGAHALLFTWPGSDPTLKPVCFAAHQDVVPASETKDSGWTHPPFSGDIAEGFVWGRGTLDCKGNLIGLLEALNNLLKSGYKPLRTIYLAFGADEEVSGLYGAAKIVETLQERGTQLSFMLDEGGAVTKGQLPGVEQPVAMVGISEKGYLSLKLRANVAGGHSSSPPERTAIGSLALALATIESNPFKQRLDVIQFIMSFVGQALPFFQRLAFANTWLFGGLLKRRMAAKPSTNAITRTTVAPTIIKAGSAENVLPAQAEAVINMRIMPGETISEVFERINDLVADEVVEVLPVHSDKLQDGHAWDPTPVADVDSPQFQRLSDLIQACFPGTLVAPIMMSGATDARYYAPICQNAFRFSPVFLLPEDIERVHAVDERLSFGNAGRMVAFYEELMRQVSSLSAEEEAEQEADEEAEAPQERQETLPARPLRGKPAKAAESFPAEESPTQAVAPAPKAEPRPSGAKKAGGQAKPAPAAKNTPAHKKAGRLSRMDEPIEGYPEDTLEVKPYKPK